MEIKLKGDGVNWDKLRASDKPAPFFYYETKLVN